MSSIYWTGGANDGNWGTAGNWNGGVPVNGSDVFIEEGSQDITSGLNQSAVTLTSLRITYGGNIGTASAPLQVNVSGTTTWSGSGQYCKISGTIAKMKAAQVSGTFYAAGGTFSILECGLNGLVEVDASCVVTTLYGCGAGINIAANGTAITTLDNVASVITTYRGATTHNVKSGALSTALGTAAAVTTLTVDPMGKYNHRSSSTITTSKVYTNGIANAYGSTYSLTVTNRINIANYTMNFDKNEKVNITFTNDATAIATEA